MAYFVIYSTSSGSAADRNVLRWGECPTASIAVQPVAATEAVIEVPALGNLATATSPNGWSLNSATGALTFFGAPYMPTAADNEAAMFEARADVTTALRASEWAMLSDAQLTTTQKAQWATYRSNLRALVSDPDFGKPNSAVALPTPPTSLEF